MSTDRDRILEQALKHELRVVGIPPAGACLDAETLASWTDGGLDGTAMAAVEAHVSNCARCQAMLAAFARSGPESASASNTQDTVDARGAFSLWRWWLAPIAAGVTAVTLWMVIPEQPQVAVAPPQAKAVDALQPRAAAESAPPAANSPAPVPERFGKDDAGKLAAAASSAREQAMRDVQRKEEARSRGLQENVALADAGAATPTSPPAPTTARPAAAAEAAVGALQKSMRADVAAIEIPTLDPSIGWRIVGDQVERSNDSGNTWAVMFQGHFAPNGGLTSGSAPSNAVCWIVGRAGYVMVTSDAGATFRDVSLAEPLDLSSVAARDAANAMIYSSDGRRFQTTDAGRTWRLF